MPTERRAPSRDCRTSSSSAAPPRRRRRRRRPASTWRQSRRVSVGLWRGWRRPSPANGVINSTCQQTVRRARVAFRCVARAPGQDRSGAGSLGRVRGGPTRALVVSNLVHCVGPCKCSSSVWPHFISRSAASRASRVSLRALGSKPRAQLLESALRQRSAGAEPRAGSSRAR